MSDLYQQVQEVDRRSRQTAADVKDIYGLIAEVKETTDRIDKRVAEQGKVLEQHGARLDALDSQVTLLATSYANQAKRLDRVDAQLLELTKGQAEHGRRLDALEKRVTEGFAAIDQRFEALEQRFEARFVGLETRFDAMGAQMMVMGAQLTTVIEMLARLAPGDERSN